MEGFGYGKGYTYLKEEFGKLLDALEEVLNDRTQCSDPCPRGHHQVRAAGRGGQLRPLDHEDHQAGGAADPGVVRYAALRQLPDRGGKERQRPQRKKQGDRRPPGACTPPITPAGTPRTALACRTKCPLIMPALPPASPAPHLRPHHSRNRSRAPSLKPAEWRRKRTSCPHPHRSRNRPPRRCPEALLVPDLIALGVPEKLAPLDERQQRHPGGAAGCGGQTGLFPRGYAHPGLPGRIL